MRFLQLRTGCAAVGVCLLMVACGSSAPRTSELVTPDQAKAVATAHVLKPLYSAMIKEDAGPARALAQAGLVLNPLATPEPTQDTRLNHNISVWVPHQTSYPVSFICYDGATAFGSTLPELYVFTKVSPASSWTVIYQMILNIMSTAPDVALDSDGYAQVIPTSRDGAFLVSPVQVAADYGAYLQAGNSTDGHEFAPGPATSAVVERNNKRIREAAQTDGATLSYAFATTDDPVFAYLLNDGSALVLTNLRATRSEVATKGTITVSKDGKGITGPAPGNYRNITRDELLFAAFIVPPKRSADKVSGLGLGGGVIRSTATRA